MGAILVCFGNYESDFSDLRQQRERTPSECSLLDRFQKRWSCGRLDDECEDPVNWDTFLLQANRMTASSGSRMLSAFYSRLLEENDDCAFFFDIRGTRLEGAYLDRVEWLNDYFKPDFRRRTLSIETVDSLVKSLEQYSTSRDCLSTTSTMVSEHDYWTSSDTPFLSENCAHNLSQRSCLGRCLSLGCVYSENKLHRTLTSPYKQEEACFVNCQPIWDSSCPKLRQCSSPQLFLTIAAS